MVFSIFLILWVLMFVCWVVSISVPILREYGIHLCFAVLLPILSLIMLVTAYV